MTRKVLVLTAGAALLVTGFALAQGPRFAATHRAGTAAQNQAAYGYQMQHQQGPSELAAMLDNVIADELGLTQADLMARKAAGETIEEIAASVGVSLEDLEAAFEAARESAIAELLAAGTINETQAAQMTARGAEAFDALIAREGCAGGQNVGGEPLHQFQTNAPRGPQAQQPYAPAMRGRHARW